MGRLGEPNDAAGMTSLRDDLRLLDVRRGGPRPVAGADCNLQSSRTNLREFRDSTPRPSPSTCRNCEVTGAVGKRWDQAAAPGDSLQCIPGRHSSRLLLDGLWAIGFPWHWRWSEQLSDRQGLPRDCFAFDEHLAEDMFLEELL